MRRRKIILTPEQLAEKEFKHIEEIKASAKIIEKIKNSLIFIQPEKACTNCKHGNDQYGGWTCGYQETWCQLLYSHIFIVSGSKKAYNGQKVLRNNICRLYEER